ncbi:PAS domain S-box protein [Clostridium sp. MSJ-11]|uniref:histidine kinase n=1 Tax=Clostridium mobile TaxID=2841512 RepID=A0ABS6EKR6_9CLOT|nr:MASE3 domain-containing protein [Clostridium mobile]MBU5485804.1 PAS domain S-box protein [Clostridium mobile]
MSKFMNIINNHVKNRKIDGFKILMILSMIYIIVLTSLFNPILVNFIMEISTVVIGYTVMIIVINIYNISDNNYVLFLGIAYAFISTLDLIHVITHNGMNIILQCSVYKSNELWVFARYLEGISLLSANRYFKKEINFKKVSIIYFLYLVIIFILVFKVDFLLTPISYRYGIKDIRLVKQLIICAIYILSIVKLKSYNNIDTQYKKYIVLSIGLKIVSQLFLIHSDGPEITLSTVAHTFKFFSFVCLYYVIIKSSLREPLNLLFNGIKNKAIELQDVNIELHNKNIELENIKVSLQSNIEKYKKIFEFLPDAVIIREEEKVIYANKALLEMLEISDKNEIIGEDLLSLIHQDCKEEVRERIMSNKKYIHKMEEKFIKRNGESIVLEVSAISILIDDKEYYLAIGRDITERKKLEEMRIKLQEREKWDNLRSEFFGNISHELKTPINVIYSALQLEDIYIENKDIDGIKKYNNIIRQNSLRLLRLSNNIIDITKIDTGFLKPNLGVFNIIEIVESLIEFVIPYVNSKNLNIIFDTEIEEAHVKCDSDMIERIVLNLISNSIKYSNENGNILVQMYCNDKDFIIINIKDDGIGIPEKKQINVFERFAQVDKSFTRICEGSGIGLSIVKAFVELQNGEIFLKSKEGVGTEITITFPLFKATKEDCATLDYTCKNENIIKKVDIEFSDIYL